MSTYVLVHVVLGVGVSASDVIVVGDAREEALVVREELPDGGSGRWEARVVVEESIEDAGDAGRAEEGRKEQIRTIAKTDTMTDI